MNIHAQVFVCTKVFASLEGISRGEIAGSYIFTFLRNFQTVFQWCTILHSHLQYIMVPIPLHPHQHVPLSFLLYPVSVRWYLIGSLICVSPILWSPDAKNLLIGKDPDAGRDWRQKEKRMVEGEMIKEHHQLSGHEFEKTLGDSEGQGSLVCSPRGCKESNNNNKY